MILTDIQVKTFGKKYNIQVNCSAIRRLTTVEWMILNCVNKFRLNPQIKKYTLGEIFEEILGLQNSNLLIKPCIENLESLDVITLSKRENQDYSKIKVGNIILTEHGKEMLGNGMLPGENTEIPIELYYNPVNYTFMQSEKKQFKNATFTIGEESELNLSFPELMIKTELENGKVGNGRFIASKYKINSIECLDEQPWNNCSFNMQICLNKEGVLTTIPAIKNEKLNKYVPEILEECRISLKLLDKLRTQTDKNIKNILGSGRKIDTLVNTLCNNSSLIFFDNEYFEYYEPFINLDDKIIVIFNSPKNGLKVKNSTIYIKIKSPFLIDSCIAFNDSNDSISLSRKNCKFAKQKISIPVAYSDLRYPKNYEMINEWLTSAIIGSKNVGLYSLLNLQSLKLPTNRLINNLEAIWKKEKFKKIIDDIETLNAVCKELNIEMIDLTPIIQLILSKAKEDNNIKQNIRDLLSFNVLQKQTDVYNIVVTQAINLLPEPNKYVELLSTMKSLGIECIDDARRFDNYADKLYNKKVINDILNTIIDERFTSMNELFDYDSLFNRFNDSLVKVCKLLSLKTLFTPISDREHISLYIKNSPDIALLESSIANWHSSQSELFSLGLNMYDRMQEINPNKVNILFDNIRIIEEIIQKIINGVVENSNVSSVDEKEEIKKTVYIVDTCAIINNSQLFEYFKPNDYVRIPTKVIDELGKIKDRHHQKYEYSTSSIARMICKKIENDYLVTFNTSNKLRFTIENCDLNLLPPELDRTTPDNQILAVALRYKNWNVNLISDDGQFRLTAKSQGIHALSSKEFIEENKLNNSKVNKDLPIKPEEKKIDVVPAELSKLSIDNFPIEELLKYSSLINYSNVSYLKNNGIKTIRDLRQLTENRLAMFKKIKNDFLIKNEVKLILANLDKILDKVKI